MEHEHEFPKAKFREVVMCRSDPANCSEIRIGTKRGNLRNLTGNELLSVVAHMMEDICVVQAMQIIHGPERGMKRAREVLGYAKSP